MIFRGCDTGEPVNITVDAVTQQVTCGGFGISVATGFNVPTTPGQYLVSGLGLQSAVQAQTNVTVTSSIDPTPDTPDDRSPTDPLATPDPPRQRPSWPEPSSRSPA